MTASVTSYSVARLESDLLQPKTRLWKTGSVDNDFCDGAGSEVTTVMAWTGSQACVVDVSCHISVQSVDPKSHTNNGVSRKLYGCLEILNCVENIGFSSNSTASYGSLPPTYEESISDVPPDYSCTDTLANSTSNPPHLAPPAYTPSNTNESSNQLFEDPLRGLVIDFSNASNMRQHMPVKKKAKGKPNKGKSNGNGRNGNGGKGVGNPDAGEGGSTGGGTGDGDNHGDRDDRDKENPDKGRKGEEKTVDDTVDDEEEQKSKEAQAKASAEVESRLADPTLEGNFDFQLPKKKKGNKRSKEIPPASSPSPPPPPPVAPAEDTFEDVKLGDAPKLEFDLSFGDSTETKSGFGTWGSNWTTGGRWGFGGISSTDANEAKASGNDSTWDFGKKNRKGGSSFAIAIGDNTGGGQSQNMDDAGVGEQGEGIDNTWVLPKNDKKSKKSHALFEDKPELREESLVEAKPENDSTPWENTSSKKNKKGRRNTSTEKEDESVRVVSPPPSLDKNPSVAADDDWSFGGKKDKKNKKKGVNETITLGDEADQGVKNKPVVADELDWDEWSTQKKDKKNRKGSVFEEKPIAVVEEQDSAEGPEPEPAEEADLPKWEIKNKKKKEKEGLPRVEENEPILMPELHSAATEASWSALGTTSSKKDKKTKRKNLLEDKEDPLLLGEKHEPDPEPAAIEESWGIWGSTSKKGKKGGMKGATETTDIALVEDKRQSIVEPEPQTMDDNTFNAWGSSSSKKEKRNKKGEIFEDKKSAPVEERYRSVVEPESAATGDIGFSVWGSQSSKKDKKGKRGAVEEKKDPPALKEENTEALLSFEPENLADKDNTWSALPTSTSKKQGRKNSLLEARANPVAEIVPGTVVATSIIAEALTATADSNWETGKKSKAGKKGKKTVELEPHSALVPAVPVISKGIEEAKVGGFGNDWSWNTGKPKKGKRNDILDIAPDDLSGDEVIAPHAIDEPGAGAAEDWDNWGGSTGKKNAKRAVVEVVEDTPADTQPDDIVEPNTEVTEVVEDSWTWGTGSKKDKKKGKKGAPPPAPTPPPPPPVPTIPAAPEVLMEDDWNYLTPAKAKGKKSAKKTVLRNVEEPPETGSKGLKTGDDPLVVEEFKQELQILDDPLDKPKKEIAAKAATKGGWGSSFGSTVTKTTPKIKVRERELELDNEPEPAQEDVVEAQSKRSKSKLRNGSVPASVLSKVDSKKGNIGKTAEVEATGGEVVKLPELLTVDPEEGKEPENDVWSFWGASKKNIKMKAVDAPSAFELDMPPIDPEPVAESEVTSPPPAKATNKSKLTKNGSRAQRVEAVVPDPVPVPEPPKAAFPLKRITTKSKGSSKKKEVVKEEAPSEANPDPEPDPASESISLPGSFPSEVANDYDLVMAEAPPAALGKRKIKKGKKIADIETSRGPEPEPESKPKAQPAPAPPPPPNPPTAEPEPPKPKQRARIIRDNNDVSWGFWGVPNKKETKPKEVAPMTEPSEELPQKVGGAAPVPARTKSAKKLMEIEVERSPSKSSSSDKASRPETRPSTSEKPGKPRKLSFLDLLSGPPPSSKPKTPRRSNAANASSQRQPPLVEPPLPTPPPEVVPAAPEMSAKAAKILGTVPQKEITLARRESKRRKDKPPGTSTDSFACPVKKSELILMRAVVENTRPPTDDDMVIVNPIVTEQVIGVPPRKESSSREVWGSKGTRTREARAMPVEPISLETDDMVLVDPPDHLLDQTLDDTAVGEASRAPEPRVQFSNGRVRRTSSTPKKPDKLLSIFGSFRSKKPSHELEYESQRRSKVYESEDGMKRQRQQSAPEDDDRRLRRDKREVRRSVRLDPEAEATVNLGPAMAVVDIEIEDREAKREERRRRRAAREAADREAREAERREAEEREARRRELEQRELEARKVRAKEARERRLRENEEREAREREEREAREREARRRARRAEREQAVLEERTRKAAEEQEAQRQEERRARRAAKERERQATYATISVPGVEDRPSKSRDSERRRSHADRAAPRSPQEEEERRARNEERKARRASKEIRSSRRQSAPPATDYFDPRNGANVKYASGGPVYRGTQPQHQDRGWPVQPHTADHTSSWVDSQVMEPAPPPPPAPPVEDVVNSHNAYDDSPASDGAGRERRRSRRESKYASLAPEEVERRRRKKESRRAERDIAFKSSDGSNPSDPYRHKRSSRRESYHGYADGVKTFDGRSAGAQAQGKSSWWKAIF
ncbi:MAG: hypothetical protein M1840_004970 [Geoglossum simile]|nr:MAG: hypothetical protein M1840_004970 [Geoglossum simile]